MKNLDKVKQEQEKFRQKLAETVKEGDEEAVAQAFGEFAQGVQESILAEAQEMMQCTDTTVLASRGVRQLTGEETKYYQKAIEAMRSSNPKQALTDMDVVMPKTVIDAVFDDLTDKHPLLDAIGFQNTSGMIEMLVNTGTKQLATWSPLTAEIVKELTGGFKKVNMGLNKLSAFIPVAKAMLDLGPAWLDRYVRTILQEALYLGLEEAIVNGTGKDQPIGMNRQVGDGVTVTGGVYPEKATVPLNSLDPVTYGTLLSGMTITPNGHYRTVESVVMIVNPNDYLTKIMPATTVRTADGTYTRDVFPFPTTVIQSVQVPENRAIIGLADRYFMGVGTGKSGKIEYSDEYHFLEDERVYLVKLYGHGEPLDNNAFVYADISGLKPVVQEVVVNEVKGTVKTKEQA
ncbi:phage major capsid protein [Agathobaculum sp. NTUH-O15-33]|uniref:phage major capsid protein n=1 Tax=Agathobaculum sp. NTUH-O15-33 TaxID=3079302 RepID=UPI002958C1F5|nr:phage major capsid protein [Agathobaculum sp. NTUH-O15-33]WNX85249.1 phage major capsid protein [Agathobaculum sp. NTUH-O15-33]